MTQEDTDQSLTDQADASKSNTVEAVDTAHVTDDAHADKAHVADAAHVDKASVADDTHVDTADTADAAHYLTLAQNAYAKNDSTVVEENCTKVLELDPDNVDAWRLLAKFGGWNSRTLDFNLELALQAISRALDLAEEDKKHIVASDIYAARKRQISEQLEAALMMPSREGARQVHEIMMAWKDLLVGIPGLTSSVLEAEATLCGNMCRRSKMGVLPGDRLIYTAYATFNHKENYGDTFRQAIASRSGGAQSATEKELDSIKRDAQERSDQYKERKATGDMSVAEEQELLEANLVHFTESINKVQGFSDRAFYVQQLEELKHQRSAIKAHKIFKRQEVDRQIAAVQSKIDQIDALLEPCLKVLRDCLADAEQCLSTIKS